MLSFLPLAMFLLKRRGETGGCAPIGCFVVLIIIGVVLFLIFRGRGDKRPVEGAAHRPMGTGPVQPNSFACPYPKCPNCGAASDKMRQQWDGMRAVTWTCGYCGNVQVQQLTDEQLPASARQRLGLDPAPGAYPPGAYPQGGFPQGGGIGSGVGGLMTGMMLGSMLGGSHGHSHGRHDDGSDGGWGGDSGSGSGGEGGGWDSGGGWGDSGGDSGGGGWDSGGDFGGDSGGGDFGGGDSSW